VAHIYLDCDGVLADFDTAAARLLGMSVGEHERRFGHGEFWKILSAQPDFFNSLELLPDAMQLFDAVKPLSPTILTGVPPGTWAAPQKRRWAARYFPGVPIITTLAALKHEHGHPGDVLIDDWASRRRAWKAAGGVFIHHRSAAQSIAALRELGFDVADTAPQPI
jgi:5' nucleotidase, deoxy (Pyrimidine), cytosolic type C protein (NT5C)